jgi:hypothetical protein
MKATRAPYTIVSGQSTASNYTSPAYSVLDIDVEAIQIDYTGSPSGTFAIYGSCNHVATQNPDGTQSVQTAGTFTPLYFSVNGGTPAPSVAVPADASPIIFDCYGSGVGYLQVVYTGSGTGTFTAVVTGKRLGE